MFRFSFCYMTAWLVAIVPLSAVASSELKVLDEATAFARSSKVSKLTVERTVLSDLLGKETKSTGTLHVRKNRFRWDLEGKEKSVLVYDGKIIWLANYPPAGFDEPIQVIKTSMKRQKEDQTLFLLLTGEITPSKSFTMVSKKESKDLILMVVKPRQEGQGLHELTIELEKKSLRSLSYKDDVNNLVTLKIEKREKLKNPSKELFQYKVPPGSEVNEP